ncbi:autophagy-related protein 9A-like [Antedon mediterranea]|uniref:autophagy-related protein 9A-like n=1 Tax=Antedon mediterranea TaxID=105859 RepID=UPI003AF4B9CF
MEHLETGYRRLETFHDDDDSPPDERNVLDHHVPDNGKAPWNHIENLDEFFTRIYQYHQKHGYACMMLSQILELVQFIFIVMFSLFMLQCVNYPVLFGEKVNGLHNKTTISDTIEPLNQCFSHLDPVLVISLIIAIIFWLHRFTRVVYNALKYWEIRSFFLTALKIQTDDLPNHTWHSVLQRVQRVQIEQRMCIHKEDLTELDIYHRILRFKNYMVAMVNKSLLPLKFRVPFLGEVVYLSNGLKYNLEIILFWGPWAPFKNYWHLREEFKRSSNREKLAEELSKHILWIGIANFVLCPFILLWQVLYSFFHYADLIKRDPALLGARKWSSYGRLYLRHFNELDHEYQARLNRGYKPATKYLNAFMSSILTVIAQNLAFFAGSILAVLIILTVYDEDVLTVEHVLTLMTLLGLVVTVCRTFIPDENMIWCPETLIQSILAQIHYMPDNWKGNAHTSRVRNEFSQLFQYKFVYYLEELVSPIVTPFILCFSVRKRALDIVDFYHNFTVDVVGVGDVCSFAEMDVRRHGNAKWMSEGKTESSQYQQAEDGKTELSLMHFTMTNPKWKPPQQSSKFIGALKDQAHQDMQLMSTLDAQNTALATSIHSITSIEGYNSILSSLAVQQQLPAGVQTPLGQPPLSFFPSVRIAQPGAKPKVKGGISTIEGPISEESSGLLSSIQSTGHLQGSIGGSGSLQIPQPTAGTSSASDNFQTLDMNFSAMYMHQLHDRNITSIPESRVLSPNTSQVQKPNWFQQDGSDKTDESEDMTPAKPLTTSNEPIANENLLVNTQDEKV